MAGMDAKWLHAQMNLAWRLVVHYLAKLIPWRTRYGLARFQQNYVSEGLPPATGDFRLLGHEPGRCTSCGSCDRVCPLLAARTDFMGPMSFILAGTRAAPHLPDIRSALALLNASSCKECRACEAACPEHIPILRIAEIHAHQDRVIEASRRGELPIVDAKRALPPWVGRRGA